MSRIIRGFATAVCAAVISFIATACGSSPTGNGNPPPPPVQETLSVNVSASVTQAYPMPLIVISVQASSNVGSVTTDCTVNGNPATCGTVPAMPGLYTVCATVHSVKSGDTKSDCKPVPVPQSVVNGRVMIVDLANDWATPKSVRVTLFKGADTASVDVTSSDGSFTLPTALANTDSVSCIVDAMPGTSRLYTARKCDGTIRKADMTKTLVLVVEPLGMTIPSGVYAGVRLPFDISLAYIAGSDGSSFYPRQLVTGVWYYNNATHKTLPQPYALRNDLGDAQFAPTDSALAWSAADVLNQYFGSQYLRAGNQSEVTTTDGVNVYISSKIAPIPAQGGVSYLGNGELGAGLVVSMSLDDWRKNPGSFRHELLHFVGVGHGCGFQSLQGQKCEGFTIDDRTGFVPGYPSKYDVLYILMLYKTRDLERKYGGLRCSIMEAHQGQREFMLKLALEKTVCQ